MSLLFDVPQPMVIAVNGEDAGFPVGRIFCVGRNYVAHAKEMGSEVDREAPWYFCKTPTAAIPSGSTVPYPPGTENYHHEMEFGIAIGADAFRVSVDQAADAIYGYFSALDMTRRDRQSDAKETRRPWDVSKDFENSAVVTAITKVGDFGAVGPQRMHLAVNGEVRQDTRLDDMVWNSEEIISHLSHFYHLRPGDIILTGTPAGVGAVVAGDVITGCVEGLDPIELTIAAAE